MENVRQLLIVFFILIALVMSSLVIYFILDRLFPFRRQACLSENGYIERGKEEVAEMFEKALL